MNWVICLIRISVCTSFFKPLIESASILEYPACGSKVNVAETCVSPANELITESSYSRTDIECLSKCQGRFPSNCSAVYRTTSDGICHIINDVVGVGVDTYNITACTKPGTLMQMISKKANNNCGSYTCPAGQICVESCASESLSSPICVVDEREACDQAMQFLNARQYWNPVQGDVTDNGTVWLVTYPKTRHDTGVRIIQHMNVRGHLNSANYCNNWYITFDGAKCTNPDTIEQLDYSETAGDFHRASDIDASKSCPSSVAFNYQYYSWNEEKNLTFDASTTNELIKSVIYTKTASETSLRLKYNALISVKILDPNIYYCGRWFLAINGTECDPIADVIIYQTSPNHWDRWRHHRRVRTVEGICDNTLDAGVYSIEVWVGKCAGHSSQPTNFISGGFNSPSRLHAQEVRIDKKVDAIYAADRRVYKSMIANMKRWQWGALDNGHDIADLLSVTYYKEFADTGLRLTASGGHRVKLGCGKWYFKIDGNGCSNPGSIGAVSSFNYDTNVHQPMQTSGVCHGIAVGSHTITYSVGPCAGNVASDRYTGWQSSFHIVVEEMRLDLVMNCGTGTPVNCDND